MTSYPATLGLILAGGRATRMGGGQKGLKLLRDRPLIAWVAARLASQCAALIVSSNDNSTGLDLPVIADISPGFQGPLAGIEAGLVWLQQEKPKQEQSKIEWLLSAPADCPFLPADLVERLHQACLDETRLCAMASSSGQAHPVVALWHVSLLMDLQAGLQSGATRKVGDFLKRHRAIEVEWAADMIDPFFNINTLEDLSLAENLAERLGEAPI